jgi:hypothetical protein
MATDAVITKTGIQHHDPQATTQAKTMDAIRKGIGKYAFHKRSVLVTGIFHN